MVSKSWTSSGIPRLGEPLGDSSRTGRAVALRSCSPVPLGQGWGTVGKGPCAFRLLSLHSAGAGLSLGSPLGLLPPTQGLGQKSIWLTQASYTA